MHSHTQQSYNGMPPSSIVRVSTRASRQELESSLSWSVRIADAMSRLDALLTAVYGADYYDEWVSFLADPAAILAWQRDFSAAILDSSDQVTSKSAGPLSAVCSSLMWPCGGRPAVSVASLVAPFVWLRYLVYPGLQGIYISPAEQTQLLGPAYTGYVSSDTRASFLSRCVCSTRLRRLVAHAWVACWQRMAWPGVPHQSAISIASTSNVGLCRWNVGLSATGQQLAPGIDFPSVQVCKCFVHLPSGGYTSCGNGTCLHS